MMQIASWLNSGNTNAGNGAETQPAADVPDVPKKVNGPEVIAIGLSRTATRSLQEGLVKLGMGPCYHMTELLVADSACEDAVEWLKAYRGEPADLQRVLKGYRSTLDAPANDFYEELMELYPDAKVILQTREPEPWANSVNNSIGKWHWHPPLGYALWDVLPNIKLQRQLARLWHAKAEKKDGTHDIDPGYMTRWNNQVKAKVPAEKLLVWSVKEGYAPICDFLGLPVPIEPFPHVNETPETLLAFSGLTLMCHLITISWLVALSSGLYFLFSITLYFFFDKPFTVEAAMARRSAVMSFFVVFLAQLKSPLVVRLMLGPMTMLSLYGLYILAGVGGVAALVLNRERLGL